jgi:homoserine dehydrogenase
MGTSIRVLHKRDQASASFRVALLGFGTVGSAVARLLAAQKDESLLQLAKVCNRDVARKKVGWVTGDVLWTDDVESVLASSDVDIVVELVGGLDPAFEWVRRALESGKSVVTANKQLIAHHGEELMELARENGQQLAFGASVAGGVPVLSSLHDGLGADRLYKVSGILNGTCNYILTRIEKAEISFEEALCEAQNAGFAEADPSDDIEGYDARAKLVILARVGLHSQVKADQVPCTSIRRLAHVDFEYAHEMGCTIRQISRAELHGNNLFASVEPALVKQDSPLASVSGSQNLVMSTGEFGGETVFSGYGAGGNPTAVAVVSDLIQIARHRAGASVESMQPEAVACTVSGDFESGHYVRFVVKDKPGIIAALAGVFSRHHINLDAVFQKPGYPKAELPFVMTLEPCRKSRLQDALAEIGEFEFLVRPPVTMPILN